MEVFEYQTSHGRKPYAQWVRHLKDKRAEAVIRNRIKRVRQGHFGDHKPIGDGVWELRIFFGPGYRIYYIVDGENVIILLHGGDKDSQFRDAQKAKEYAADYWRRK